MREALNKVVVEGILSEIDLEERDYVNGRGENKHCVSGTIKIKTKQRINSTNDKETDLEVPISIFANQTKNDGGLNPIYASVMDMKNNWVSLAAAGGDVSQADCVRITSGKVQMNEYYNPQGQLVSFPRITATFINKIPADRMHMKATFEIQGVVDTCDYEVLPNGDEGPFVVSLVVPGYNDSVDVVKIHITRPDGISFVRDNWSHGDSVKATGSLKFTAQTETVLKEQAFGDPIEETRTVSVSQLVLTGGDYPYDEALAWNTHDIGAALTIRKQRLEENRTKAAARRNAGSTKSSTPSRTAADLGF